MPDVIVRTNIPDFRRQLRALGDKVERKVARAAVAKGARLLAREVKQQAPMQTGVLKRAIYTGRSRYIRGKGVVAYFVSLRQGRKQRSVGKRSVNRDAFYWRWVEGGHRIVPRGGALRGGERTRAIKRGRFDKAGGRRTEGRWFVRTAFQRASGTALREIITDLGRGIEAAGKEK